MADPVRLERDGAVAVLVLDDPPLNLFGKGAFEALEARVAEVEQSDARALVWRAEGEVFTGGADVNTFVDTAVFDVPTRKLLFRAPGVSEITSSTTLVEIDSDRRATQQKGFDEAMGNMTVNLDKELDAFKERIREDQSVRISYTPSYRGGGGGGGAAGLLALAGIALLLGLRHRAC